MGCICFFNTAIAWGGGEKWHLEASSHLHHNGHDVLVVAHTKSVLLQKLRKTDIPVVSVKMNNLSFLNPLKRLKLKKELAKHTIDTLIMNLSRDVKIAGISAKALGVKRIIYRRGSAIPIKNTFLNRYYFKHVLTEVLANSKATKQTILENNPHLFPQEKIRVIYNGIDIPKEFDHGKSERFAGKGVLTLVNLGRLEAQKNQVFLIELVRELKNRDFPIKLIIGGDGRLKGALQDKIVQLDVGDQVELAGFVERPLEFISKGHVFVLPSLWEGFGYVLAEAALCKIPIVAFDLSSNPELVVNGKTGYLIKSKKVNDFADAIEELYRNPSRIQQMGEQGYVHVKANFDKKNNLKEVEDYLVNG